MGKGGGAGIGQHMAEELQSPEFAPPTPSLQNVVATFEMGKPLDLALLAMKCTFIHYAPRKFAAGIMRLAEPRTTCLVFASGKAVCTGANTEQLACIAALKFVLLLQNNGIHDVCFRNFKVQNIVAAAHCPFTVELMKLADTVSGYCSYEPNLFPGLMYRVRVEHVVDTHKQQKHDTGGQCMIPRPKKPRTMAVAQSHSQLERCKQSDKERSPSTSNEVVFIVFQSGRCVITGGKSRLQILQVWRNFFSTILVKYRAHVDHGTSGHYRVSTIASASRQDQLQTQMLVQSLSSTLPLLIRELVQGTNGEVPLDLDPCETGFQDKVFCARAFQDICEFQDVPADKYCDGALTMLLHRAKRLDALPFHRMVAPELGMLKSLAEFLSDHRHSEVVELPESRDPPFQPISVVR